MRLHFSLVAMGERDLGSEQNHRNLRYVLYWAFLSREIPFHQEKRELVLHFYGRLGRRGKAAMTTR